MHLVFPSPGKVNYKIYPKNAKFLTWIVSKEKTEQFNFFKWLSIFKNLVLSNGSKNVQNVIQMASK